MCFLIIIAFFYLKIKRNVVILLIKVNQFRISATLRCKVKAARGFLSSQRERRARCSERCSRCSSGAAALGQWVTTAPLVGGMVGEARTGRVRRCCAVARRSRHRHVSRAYVRARAPLVPMSSADRAGALG